MKKSILLIASALVFASVGCDKADKAAEGIKKAKEFVDETEKKVTDRKKEFDRAIEKVIGENKEESEKKKDQRPEETDD